MKLIIALLLLAPLASAEKLTLNNAGAIELGMNRAQVSSAAATMDGRLVGGETVGCSTIDSIVFSSHPVYAGGEVRFERILGERCEIPIRVDKAFNIELDYVEGIDGQAVLDEHLKAFGKPFKKEGHPDSGLAYYEWRKAPFSVLLVLNLRSGFPIRKEVRDIGMDLEIKKAEKRMREAAEKTAAASGVPNFREVSPGVFRGGQPTAAGWKFLKAKGVKTVVKLNLASEGSDDGAVALGMTVIDASGPPSTLRDVLGAPRPERIKLAVETLRDESLRPVYVHCKHGEDRTGLIVGLYRVLHEGRTKADAYKEMEQNGFHRSLRGLREIWKTFDGKTLPGGEK